MNMVLNLIFKNGDARKIRDVTDVTVSLSTNKFVYKVEGQDYVALSCDDVLQIQTYPLKKEQEWQR